MHAHANLPDEDILQRLRLGDIDALATFYDRHHHPALCLAVRLGCDLVQAEQAVEEAFLLLWRNAARYRREDDWTPRAWLLGMVAYRSRRLIGQQEQRVVSRASADEAYDQRVIERASHGQPSAHRTGRGVPGAVTPDGTARIAHGVNDHVHRCRRPHRNGLQPMDLVRVLPPVHRGD